ncbi:hypothetical protein TNCV_3387061 [Trichonephila clavipes]|nr:hypothetical protein TNCV_3387061 [Trichonephila clavipes]
MFEDKLLEHIISRLEPQILDYEEVRTPTTKARLLQLVTSYEDRYTGRETQASVNNIRKQYWDARLVVSKEGVRTDETKVKVITEMKSTKNAQEKAKFWGMIGRYQKFTKDYADLCEQLYKLKRKSVKFIWSKEAQTAFVTNYPNEIVSLDLLGPYPASQPERYRYILVIMDHFTKWVDVIPLRKASTKIVANTMFENYTLLDNC